MMSNITWSLDSIQRGSGEHRLYMGKGSKNERSKLKHTDKLRLLFLFYMIVYPIMINLVLRFK